MKYNHAFDVAFSVESNHPTGDDITETELFVALVKRAVSLYEADETREAVGAPFDTYEVDNT